jgi:hypothetical protein
MDADSGTAGLTGQRDDPAERGRIARPAQVERSLRREDARAAVSTGTVRSGGMSTPSAGTDPVTEVSVWFARRKFVLTVERDERHDDWSAALSSRRRLGRGRVLQARYGTGATAAEAALRARERYQQEQ